MRLLLVGGLIAAIGLSALPVQAQVEDAQVKALVEALRQAAPQTGTEKDGLYGDWKVEAGNIPRWSKQCTGRLVTPEDFADSPVTARYILVCVMRDIFNQQYLASGNNEALAVQRAAAWWMTGQADRYNRGDTAEYTKKVLDYYEQLRKQSPPLASQAPEPTPTPKPPQARSPRIATGTAKVSDIQVGALVEALRLAAPKTGTNNDGLYGDWKVEANNIPRWSKQCVGREITPNDFADSPVTARYILACVMGDVFQKQYIASNNNESQAVQRAASWWMSGDYNQYNSDNTIGAYTQKVLSFYQQLRSDNSIKPMKPTLLPHR